MVCGGEVAQERPYTTHRVPQLDSNVDAGAFIMGIFRSNGPFTRVLLPQNSSFNLLSVIAMEHDHQEIATEGYPVEHARKAKLYICGREEAGAVFGKDKANIVIRCLHFIGCREEMGWLTGGAAVIIIGGWHAKDPVLEDCVIEDPRGWSGCHLVDGSQGGRIIGNVIGPCGQPPPDGPWADGLSIACQDGIIANNTIVDATDGAIVVFCAPGTLVTGNTIIARSRNLLGGINLVDPFPFDSNYSNTRVINNRIISEGAFIHLGIGVGPACWGDDRDTQNYGGIVMDNIIGPGRFGYGFAAAGCRDFKITQNRIAEGTHFAGSMDGIPDVSPPAAFIRGNIGKATGTFQSEFVEGPVRYLIGIRDGLGSSMKYSPGNLRWEGGTSEGTQNGAVLRGVRFEVTSDGRLVILDQHHSRTVIWSSPPADDKHKRNGPFRPVMTLEGRSASLTIRNESLTSQEGQREGDNLIYDATPYLSAIGYQSITKDPSLVLQDTAPYLQVQDGGNTLFTTNPEFRRFELVAGHFVAVAPSAHKSADQPPSIPHGSRPTSLSERLLNVRLRKSSHGSSSSVTHNQAPPPLPPRTPGSDTDRQQTRPDGSTRATYLYLHSATSELILHTSRLPTQPEAHQIVWKSPNWKRAESTPSDPSKAVLQGDGNFVIYASSEGAVWASGSNEERRQAQSIAIIPSGEDRHGARIELRGDGRLVWGSRG